MTADTQGNDLNAVSVPITGLAAFAPLDPPNVIKDADMGASPIVLPVAYRKLGLYKSDGGPEDGRDDDATEFFQQGYKIAGNSTRSVKIGLAEDNTVVNELIEGKKPSADGVIYVDASLPDTRFLLFVATSYRNGTQRRRNGVARVSAVEVDQEERGSVRGVAVTFEWSPDPLFQGKPFKQWLGVPAAAPTGGA